MTHQEKITTCAECGDKEYLYYDPRTPPLKTEACLCESCWKDAIEFEKEEMSPSSWDYQNIRFAELHAQYHGTTICIECKSKDNLIAPLPLSEQKQGQICIDCATKQLQSNVKQVQTALSDLIMQISHVASASKSMTPEIKNDQQSP